MAQKLPVRLTVRVVSALSAFVSLWLIKNPALAGKELLDPFTVYLAHVNGALIVNVE